MQDRYIGGTASKVTELLRSARGGVLFIDEAIGLAGLGGHSYSKDALDTLLSLLGSDEYKGKLRIAFKLVSYVLLPFMPSMGFIMPLLPAPLQVIAIELSKIAPASEDEVPRGDDDDNDEDADESSDDNDDEGLDEDPADEVADDEDEDYASDDEQEDDEVDDDEQEDD
jgi:hypothetical protein